MIVLAVLGLLASVALPYLRTTSPKKERAQVVTSINRLLQRAWRGAIAKQKNYEVHVDVEKKVMWLSAETDKRDSTTERVELKLPRTFEIKNFYIGDKDEMRGHGGRATTEMWFYVSKEGIAQRVIMNVLDRNDARANRAGKQVGLVLNPFIVQFKEHDAFKNP